MLKPDFERCTKEATKLLYHQDVSNRILNIQNLIYDRNIIFDTIQNYSLLTGRSLSDFLSEDKQMLKDGCTIYIPNVDTYLILYNGFCSHFEHLNWTLAHEIGHVYLGHSEDGDLEEVEAHFFASQLFMPEYSIFMMAHEYGSVDASALTEIFGVSQEAANKRINTMNKKHSVIATKKDKEIWDLQKERIAMYYDCLKDGTDYRTTLILWEDYKREYERAQRAEMYSQMLYY